MPAGLARWHREQRAAKAGRTTKRRRKKAAKKVAKRARRKSFAKKASGRIRPVVIVSGGKYHRPKKSKYFSGPTRINPRRRRKYRRNPSGLKGILPFRKAFSKQSLMRYVAIGGGIGLGAMLSRFLNTGAIPFLPGPATTPGWVVMLQKARPVHGLIHILVGVTIAAKVRNPIAKDAGAGLAALGGFDLLMQGLTFAGVKNLPSFSGMNVDLMGMNYDIRQPFTVGDGGYRGDTDEFIDSLDT